MKKLMVFALALASVGGAYAADGCQDTEVTTNSYFVYNLKFSGKTTTGSAKAKNGSSGLCGDTTAATTNSWRNPNKAICIDGWIVSKCGDCEAVLSTASAAATKFWATKPYKSSISGATFVPATDGTFPHVIGSKNADAEMYAQFNGTLDDMKSQTIKNWNCAGFGKFGKITIDYKQNIKGSYYTSFSGNFAGTMSAPYYLSSSSCEPVDAYKCTDLSSLTDPDTIAYGTWSMKYNSSASKKYQTKGTLPSYPSWLDK